MSNFRFKLSLIFRIFDPLFDPNQICEQLQLTPITIHKMGESRVDKKGKPLGGTYENSYCFFELAQVENEDLHEAIERISKELENHRTLLGRVKRSGGSVEFLVGWFTPFNSSETFDSTLLSNLGALGIDLDFDVYCEQTVRQ